MNFDNYLLKYKYYILFNANENGWEIYKKDENIYYLRKKKIKNEKFELDYEISIFHKQPFDIEKKLKEIEKK